MSRCNRCLSHIDGICRNDECSFDFDKFEDIGTYNKGYQQGRADRDKEIAEHSVFISNKPIEDIVLDARADERAKVLEEVSNLKNEYTDACNMCTKTDCNVCPISNFIDQLENIISNK